MLPSGRFAVIEKIPFGSTGHESARTIFGAAALGAMKAERAERVLETLLEFGVNHIDTAAAYGDSELVLAAWLRRHRDDFFLATKTGERSAEGARASLERSLERMGVDRVDLIQLHNLVDAEGWQTAMGPGGAVEALAEARDAGLVRFIGVTGHGTRVAEMHLRSLEQFAFDSVLLPYNFAMLEQSEYAADLEKLLESCAQRGVAVQTIKSIARRRWTDETGPRFSWYEPIRDPEALEHAVHFVLSRPGLFLNTSSDATLLRATLEAASTAPAADVGNALSRDVARLGIEPLFVRGVSETV
jgi:aryl-alcohol dehydrogenase-like predicted oxidoreductase